jgi:restriction system protein
MPEDLAQKLPSGVQTVFANRIAWSVVYLAKAGALERIKRGVFRITGRGTELLSLNVPRLTVQNLSKFPEFVLFHKGSQSTGEEDPETKREKAQTPEEQLANAHKVLRDPLANDILETVEKTSPKFFEELVIELLVAMGYGGSAEDAGRAVGKSGDGGIDGIIKEDSSAWMSCMFKRKDGRTRWDGQSFRHSPEAWKVSGRRKECSSQPRTSRRTRWTTSRKSKSGSC